MDFVHNGYIYIEVSKGMYGLPQAGRVASDELIPRLEAAGYMRTKTTPGLFKHKTNSVVFCLTVDNFGVKYTLKEGASDPREDALHLRDTLKKYYPITEDWEGDSYCGLDVTWNYNEQYVDISMKAMSRKHSNAS